MMASRMDKFFEWMDELDDARAKREADDAAGKPTEEA